MNELAENKRVSFYTLGCRLNMSESGSVAQGFVDRGFEVVSFGAPADVVFINTCTVTDGADSSCRQIIRQAHQSSPEGKIVVAGCYAQMEPEKIARMDGVDLILGTQEKYKVFDYLEEEEGQVIKVDKTTEFWGATTTLADGDHTRAFLKIQDGCNYVCSFCIIPFARGRSRTITVEEAVREAIKLLEQGYQEIVLTGVNIGEYDSTSGEKLSDLVAKILALPYAFRLRLSSVEPNTFSDELIQVLKSSPKFMPHFHIPLQSGDDGILKAMRRKYDATFYKELVRKLAFHFPEASFGGDIIVGFPGETPEAFQSTCDLVSELPMTHLHVFPYSKRKGTTASRLIEQVHHQEKKERIKKLITLGEEKLGEFAKEWIGESVDVLFEQKKNNLWSGHSPQYLTIKVQYEGEESLKNQRRQVLITSYNEEHHYLIGTLQ
jgi:threonylcarbamoyladenosine tRNA methylthiotransferase MtaB